MENRIKEQMCLLADRLSTGEMKEQPVASLLLRAGLHAGRSAAADGPERHRMGRGAGRYHPPQAAQDRAAFRIGVRRVVLQLSSTYPWKDLFAQTFHALRC
jgi:hypothetical protein